MNKLFKDLTRRCMVVLCIALASCTTTNISSHTIEEITKPYESLIVAFTAGGDFQKKKTVEEKITSAIQNEGTTAIPSYKVFPYQAEKDKIYDAILLSGADAILLIQRGDEREQSYTFNGNQQASGIDSRGRIFTYQTPNTENYSSISRGFRATLTDIRKNKVIWIAGSKSQTLAPAELRMFSDFHDSTINSYINALLDEMKKNGLIRKK
ncbi:hypothetical protein GCM10010975_24720 [Comamonas phosphati]|nr:hypothetical protein GCM10010975_24720 [Comamonas phosphati]